MDEVNDSSIPDKNVPEDSSLPPPRLDPVQPADIPNLPVVPVSTPPAQPAVPTPHSANQTSAAMSTPQIADDTDLIEKEWVEKAKHIIEQTKNDPHLRNREINKIKADYIKKRYNKDIETTGD